MECRSNFRRTAFAIAAALSFCCAGILSAQTLPVTGDTHVNGAFPNLNFGNSVYLSVGGATRSYLKFDLSSLPAGAGVAGITKVNLILWVGRTATAGSIQVSEVGGAWDESTLTFNTQPATGVAVGSAASPANPPPSGCWATEPRPSPTCTSPN